MKTIYEIIRDISTVGEIITTKRKTSTVEGEWHIQMTIISKWCYGIDSSNTCNCNKSQQ